MKSILTVEDRVYKIEDGFEVPDKTMVFPIFGPRQQQLAGLEISDYMSLAMGELEKLETSSIHVHPLVAHLTWVMSGSLSVKMKDPENNEAYRLDLNPMQAVYTAPGTFFQLINRGVDTCKILYQVAPAFVFDMTPEGEVRYNDAIVLSGYSWEKLKEMNWKIPELDIDLAQVKAERQAAINRMNNLK